jgi:hypothetical protein
MGKWLRQQSKYFYAAGFDALVKRWDKCINVVGGYEINVCSMFEYHILVTLPRNKDYRRSVWDTSHDPP